MYTRVAPAWWATSTAPLITVLPPTLTHLPVFFYATTSQRLARRRDHEGRPRRVWWCVARRGGKCGGVWCGELDGVREQGVVFRYVIA